MKRLSLNELAQSAGNALQRFPLVILCAFVGSMLGIYLVEIQEVAENIFPLINLAYSASMGIPLYFAIGVFLEKERLFSKYRYGIYLLATLMLALVYFSLPNIDVTQNTFQPYVRYGIYNACLHLLISFLPFISDRNVERFWSYNITLFMRVLSAFLYSMVLYIGIALALFAVHLLFDVDFGGKIYPQLFILFVGLFNIWFFLSGVPKDVARQEGVQPVKALKFFGQYILLPLLAVYLLILYGYGVKIVMAWDWPRGIVAYLITCVALLGIAAFLFLYPYGRRENSGWIRKMAFAFHCLMLPLLVLLFIAVSIRLGEYGITVNRYLIFVLGIWLSMVCLYFTLGKGNIKFIPMSLAILFFLVSFGPWGVFAVSEKSQVERLRAILSQGKILKDDKIHNEIIWDKTLFPQLEPLQEAETMVLLPDSLYLEVSSIMYYLDKYHGFAAIRPWFSQDVDRILATVNDNTLKRQRMQEPQIYMHAMGLKHSSRPGDTSSSFYSYQADLGQAATPVQGYDYLVSFNINKSESKEFIVDGEVSHLQVHASGEGLVLTSGRHSIALELSELMKKLHHNNKQEQHKANHSLPQSELVHVKKSHPELKLEIHHLNFQSSDKGKMDIQFISGFLLIRKRE